MPEEARKFSDERSNHRDLTQVTRGAAAFLSGTGVGLVSALAVTILMTRVLGVEGYGVLSLAIAFVVVVQSAVSLGLPNGVTRMMAFESAKGDEEAANRMFRAALLTGLASSLLATAAILALVWAGVLDRFGNPTLLAIVCPILIASGIRWALYGALRALRDVKALLVVSLVTPFLDLAAVGFVASTGTRSASWYGIALVAAAFAELPLLAYLVRRRRRFGPLLRVGVSDAKKLLSFSLPFVLVNFMFLALHQADVLILGAFHPPATLGLYVPVMRLAQTAEKVLGAFPSLYLPIAAAHFAENRIEDLKNLYLSVTKWAYALGFAIILSIVVAPALILPTLFGGPFEEMVSEARILALGYWTVLLTGTNGVTLAALGLQKRAATASALAIVVNLAVGFLIIPPLAAAGAAWSNTIAYGFMNVVMSVMLYRASGVTPFRRDTASLFGYSVAVAFAGAVIADVGPSSKLYLLVVWVGSLTVWFTGVFWIKRFEVDLGEMRRMLTVRKKPQESLADGGPKSSSGSPVLREQVTAHGAGGTDAPVFPIFVGRGRSGTTLVRAIFDNHPSVAIPPESPFIVSMAHRRHLYEKREGLDVDRFVEELTAHPRFPLWDLSEEDVRRALSEPTPEGFSAAMRRVYGLYAARRGKSRYGDKSPRTSGALPLLAELFPEARFVHIVRDGRDVALSHFDLEFGPDNVIQAALDWKREVGGCRRAGRRLGPERYMELKYEDLVADPAAAVRRVCDFISVDFQEGMLQYFERADRVIRSTPVPTAHERLVLPPTKGLRDWRSQMPRHDAHTFDVLAGDLLNDLGYEQQADHAAVRVRLQARTGQLAVVLPRRLRRFRNRWLRPSRVLRRLRILDTGIPMRPPNPGDSDVR